MSVLSPIAAAILGNLQANVKNDGKQDANAFISLLETSGQTAANTQANTDTTSSIVDALYSKPQDDAPPPAATPTAPPVDDYARQAQLQQQARQQQDDATARANENSDNAPKQAAKNDAPAEKPAAKKDDSDNNDVKAAPAPKKEAANDTKQPRSLQSVRKSQAEEKKPKSDDDNTTADATTPADQIRAKIQQLNDILNLLSSLPAGTQVSIVQVTQANTLTESQQDLGVVPVMADLSDRLKQLLAAVTTGQNLPPGTQAALSKVLGSFKDLVASFAQGAEGGQVNPDALTAQLTTTKATLTEVLQALQAPQAAAPDAQAAQVVPATDLPQALAGAAPPQAAPVVAASDNKPATDVNKDLQQLSQWVDDVRQIIAPKAKAPVTAAAPKIADALSVPGGQNTPVDTSIKAGTDTPIASTVNAAAAAIPTVTQPVQNNTAIATHAATAAAVENTAGSSGNSAGGNDQSGQGGDRTPAGPIQGFGAPGAPTSTSETTAASFSKTLKAASAEGAPVAEQVAFNIKTAVKDGASKIQIQLDPLELGKLHIKIDMDSNGKATGIVVTADNKSTLDLLQRDARGLQNALADAGIKADSGSLSFNLRGGDQGQQQQEQRQSAASYAPVLPEEDELAPLAVVSRNYVVSLSDGLDIQI